MPSARIIPLRPKGRDPIHPAVTIRDLRVAEDASALLDGVSLGLGPFGITVVIGPKGAGKGVLLRVLSNLIRPDHGQIRLSEDLGAPAFVFPRPTVLRRSVGANLTHALRLAGVPRRDRLGRLAELLVLSELTAVSEHQAHRLCLGDQQRLAIARALATDPGLLLLDQPTSGLDPMATAAIEALVREIADRGVKVVVTTQDTAQAERLADDIVFLHKGRVVEHRDADRFFTAPTSAQAQAYLDGHLLT